MADQSIDRARRSGGVLTLPQNGRAQLRVGKRFSADVEVSVTPGGFLAIGGMVALILLGSAVIVHAARR